MTDTTTSAQHRFEQALTEQLTKDENAAREAIRGYFGTDGGVFTGSLFELLAGSDPYRFTAQDLVAVNALSETIPPQVSYWLLSAAGTAQTSELLRRVPIDVDIWDDDAEALLVRGGPLWDLWDLLRRGSWPHENPSNGMGPTRTSKLLAVKRPRLVPIQDSVVSSVLPTNNLWEAMRLALRNPDRRKEIADLTAEAPRHVSLLRRIDAVVWYLNRDRV